MQKSNSIFKYLKGISIPLSCDSNQCRNNATCVQSELTKDGMIAYSCKCNAGFSGPKHNNQNRITQISSKTE